MSNLPKFTKYELTNLFEPLLNKTLGEADVQNEFDRTIGVPRINGIAGDVVEVSILGKEKDNKQEADIVLDGKPTEV